MSDAVSALSGAAFQGFSKVEEAGLRGMITLRGDLTCKTIAAAVKAAIGTKMPALRKVETAAQGAAAWMSPDELLLIVPYNDVSQALEILSEKLIGTHALAANVSDARAVFRVSGDDNRDVLAKLAPVDFSRDVFLSGDIRRSRIAQVPAAFWLNSDDSFDVVCFRSVAQYVFDVLKLSAKEGGEIGI